MTWKEMFASVALAFCVIAFFIGCPSTDSTDDAEHDVSASLWAQAAEWELISAPGNEQAVLHAGVGGTGFGNAMQLRVWCTDGAVSELYFTSPNVSLVSSTVEVRIGEGRFERQEWSLLPDRNGLELPVELMTQLLFADVMRVRAVTEAGSTLTLFNLRRTAHYLGRMQCTA